MEATTPSYSGMVSQGPETRATKVQWSMVIGTPRLPNFAKDHGVGIMTNRPRDGKVNESKPTKRWQVATNGYGSSS